jgi:hypothetical protein
LRRDSRKREVREKWFRVSNPFLGVSFVSLGESSLEEEENLSHAGRYVYVYERKGERR